MGLLSVVKNVPNALQINLPTHLLETNVLREGAMIHFLGLRAEEPEELYHRNPVLKARTDTGCKRKLPNDERNCNLRAT